MKTAYERALERSGGALNELSDEKKKEIAELDVICRSKIAEAEITAENKIKSMDPAQVEAFRESVANEIRSIRAKYDAKKQAVRDR